jgi:hypothetical protein
MDIRLALLTKIKAMYLRGYGRNVICRGTSEKVAKTTMNHRQNNSTYLYKNLISNTQIVDNFDMVMVFIGDSIL